MEEDRNFAYQILQHKDLSNRDLRNSDFTNAVLDDVDLTDSDLRGSCFMGADLRRIHITMECRTMENVRYDDSHIKLLLALLLQTNIAHDELPNEIVSNLRHFINTHDTVKLSDVLSSLFTTQEFINIKAYFNSINP